MEYLIWLLIGGLVGGLVWPIIRRRPSRLTGTTFFLAGAFGALLGGMIGDGLPDVLAHQLNLPSIGSAILGALFVCMVTRDITASKDE